MIEKLDQLQLFYGEEGENILYSIIVPNTFIGAWNWIGENVMLYFKTDDRFERRSNDNTEIYSYSYTSDSITIQIIKPDIFMGSITYEYE